MKLDGNDAGTTIVGNIFGEAKGLAVDHLNRRICWAAGKSLVLLTTKVLLLIFEVPDINLLSLYKSGEKLYFTTL